MPQLVSKAGQLHRHGLELCRTCCPSGGGEPTDPVYVATFPGTSLAIPFYLSTLPNYESPLTWVWPDGILPTRLFAVRSAAFQAYLYPGSFDLYEVHLYAGGEFEVAPGVWESRYASCEWRIPVDAPSPPQGDYPAIGHASWADYLADADQASPATISPWSA